MDLNMHLEERAPDCAQITMTTYTSDVSGVASALYELGGMTVIHDASGCNSTYSTHDEPRWETMNSAVFISALNEMDAVLGNEALLTENLIDAVKRLDPAFTALAGTIIPMMTGSDLRGMAADVEAATGVPAFALSTNGMRAYSIGAAQAWIELARRFVPREAPAARLPRTVNLLGATPLDFSIGGEIDSIRSLLEHAGIRVLADWAMGSTLEDLRRTREAALNIVVSSAGLPLAQVFSRHFGMPFLTALPIGEAGAHRWLDLVESALERALAFPLPEAERDLSHALGRANDRVHPEAAAEVDLLVLHEPLRAVETARAFERDLGLRALPLSALPALGLGDARLQSELAECEFDAVFAAAACAPNPPALVADPLFRAGAERSGLERFVPFPHEAASGRIYRSAIPNLFSSQGWERLLEAVRRA